MMNQEFVLAAGLIGRFAIVKLWPDIKAAEDECIARLKIASQALGIECIEVHANGALLSDPSVIVTKNDVDFVLHLHYDTPKLYDVFSFVALWNPTEFYHQWGYQRTSRNLLSHDDFISCSSTAADDHVARMIRGCATHLPPLFHLYHSIADVVHAPSLGDQKLFYAGINWEALNGGTSRHQEVLKRLDKTGLIRIYGPNVFQNVKVWDGYDSYVREIPFDGVSMLDEISKAGIALVLSSPAHKNAELMSNRLFESVAAGALIICDENKFASRFFGDSLLYIDSRDTVEKIVADIQRHLAWAKANPDLALAMIAKAQAIFRQTFTLKKNLADIFTGLQQRKSDLLALQHGRSDKQQIRLGVFLLMPTYSADVLAAHMASIATQQYRDFAPALVIDRSVADEDRAAITQALAKAGVPVALFEDEFLDPGAPPKVKARRKLGNVIANLLEAAAGQVDAVVFVAPNEALYSNHLDVLAGSLMRNPDRQCVATSAIVTNGDAPVHGVHEQIDFTLLDGLAPIGFARFAFRCAGLPRDLSIALPYLDRKVLAALVDEHEIVQEIPSTVIIEAASAFPDGAWNEAHENAVIADFAPEAFTPYYGFTARQPSLEPRPTNAAVPMPYSRLSRRWLKHQIKSLRTDGLTARFDVLKARLRLGSADKAN
jgi:hypothetical protein